MKNKTCALFDMDGVILDTEPQYDIFWQRASVKYNIGIPRFEKVIKGTTLPNILKKYFAEYSKEEIEQLVADIEEFETTMNFPEIDGSIRFVNQLKEKGIKVGLVTSSLDNKMVGVYQTKGLDKLFDTIVTGSHIKEGKPHPECYSLAAEKLGVKPEHCVVFEDSFAGIESGKAAGMKVVGLATTHSHEALSEKCETIIPNFKEYTYSDFEQL